MKTKAYFTDNGTNSHWITGVSSSIPAVPWYPHSSTPCPNCGYCPYCGRSNEKPNKLFEPTGPVPVTYGTIFTTS